MQHPIMVALLLMSSRACDGITHCSHSGSTLSSTQPLPSRTRPLIALASKAKAGSGRTVSLFDAMAIVGGSAVGGGFLAVPAITAPLGVLPSAAGLVATWIFLVLAALSYVEAAGAAMADAPTVAAVSDETQGDSGGASILAISRRCFGDRLAVLLSSVFLAQMLAIITANLVKAAELSTVVFPALSFSAGAWMTAVAFGSFVFAASTQTVALTNSVLTTAMCIGFLLLFAVAAVVTPSSSTVFSHAKWAKLLPRHGWAIPIFTNVRSALKLRKPAAQPYAHFDPSHASYAPCRLTPYPVSCQTLRFGEAVPVVLGQLGTSRLREARLAVVCGSLLPLLLAIGWSAASVSLASLAGPAVGGAAVDPVLALLRSRPVLAAPIALIAVGAIGSTMLGVLLACSQLLSDIFCGRDGARTPMLLAASRFAVVALPASLACLGPGLYLKLLAFSGAFPTIVLYGLLPPLAALVLRRKRNRGPNKSKSAAESAGRFAVPVVPGGKLTLFAVAFLACTLLGINVGLLFV